MVLLFPYLYQYLKIMDKLKQRHQSFTEPWLNSFERFLKSSKSFKRFSIIILTNPSARAGYDTRSIFKRSLTGLNSEFSFSYTSCLTKAEKPSLPNYLPIAGGRIFGFIPFPRVLVLCDMQSVRSRIKVFHYRVIYTMKKRERLHEVWKPIKLFIYLSINQFIFIKVKWNLHGQNVTQDQY